MNIISQARELRTQFVRLRELASDEVALQVLKLYPTWKVGTNYVVGDRILYNDALYKVLQDHASQVDWTPDVSPSLFAKVLIPNEATVYEWEQPDSTNAYVKDDKVLHNGKTWISTIDNNVWEPGVYGWEEI